MRTARPTARRRSATSSSPVDGSGSGLDADSLDGHESSAFAAAGSEEWHEVGTACEPAFRPRELAEALTLTPANDVARRGLAVFVLPPGYRPAGTASNGSPARVDAYTDGAISPAPPSTGADAGAWLSLSGVSFRCAPSGSDGRP